MKILLVRNAFVYDFGGGERFPVHLAMELTKLGHDPIVLSAQPRLLEYAKDSGVTSRKGLWWARQNWSGWRVVFFPIYIGWQVILFFWYINLIQHENPDVVHLQSKDDFIAGTLAGHLLRRRVIWTDHADLKHVYKNYRHPLKNPVGKLVFLCSKLSHAVTLVSQSEAALITESLGTTIPSNYTVIHNGAFDQEVQVANRAPEDEDAIIFCSTSRLVTAKGIGELIKAFTSFPSSDKVRLWLVGDGPDEDNFMKLAKKDPRIVFWGHEENPLPLLAAADIFVHPTYHEGFSLSVVEATMLGKPMVITNVGGNPEIANSTNSILVPPQDTDSLFKVMYRLYVDADLRESLGLGSRKTFESGFDFARIVKERFVPLYETKETN